MASFTWVTERPGVVASMVRCSAAMPERKPRQIMRMCWSGATKHGLLGTSQPATHGVSSRRTRRRDFDLSARSRVRFGLIRVSCGLRDPEREHFGADWVNQPDRE